MGGLFFEFGAVRTESRDRDAPHRYIITISDKQMDYDMNFMAYFITRLPNPTFSPELQAKTTVVDFTVTQKGCFFSVLTCGGAFTLSMGLVSCCGWFLVRV